MWLKSLRIYSFLIRDVFGYKNKKEYILKLKRRNIVKNIKNITLDYFSTPKSQFNIM